MGMRSGHRGVVARRALPARRAVERGCDGRRTALVGEAANNDRPLQLPDPHLDRVTCPKFLRRLHAGVIEVNPTAVNGVGGCAPCLEESCCPEPLVNADMVHAAVYRIVSRTATVTMSESTLPPYLQR